MVEIYGINLVEIWVELYSVTRWLHCFSIFGRLQKLKLARKHKILAKVGSKFYQILNKPVRFDQEFNNIAKMVNFRQIRSHR